MTLPKRDRDDLFVILHENVFGEAPAPEFVDALIEKAPGLMADGVLWGFHDAIVRKCVMSRCSEWLIGRVWPIYGDRLTEEQFTKFIEDVKTAYNEWVAENRK